MKILLNTALFFLLLMHGYGGCSSLPASQNQYELMTNYVNWAIYARDYFVTDLPADKLTRINYAFANINAGTGQVFLTDEWADLQYKYPGDDAGSANTLLGNFNQLFRLKTKNRKLKTILSVGGWTYASNFSPGLANAENRDRFVNSSVTLVADLGLDGIDINWEYPANTTDAENLVAVVKALRAGLDTYAANHVNGYRFLITISCPAVPQNYEKYDVSGMDEYVDAWNLMAFDYSGQLSHLTGHMSNVFPSENNPASTPFNTDQAVQFYKKHISSPSKLILGSPVYGRSFTRTSGMGQAFQGVGAGTWEVGVYDYKALPLPGSEVCVDEKAVASWSQDSTKMVVSFDTPAVAAMKAHYVKEQQMGGVFWWEASADKVGNESLVSTVFSELGAKDGQSGSMNCLDYPLSKYENIRTQAMSS